ncbi:MAG TPA: glycosyltransferase [Kiritimatiellia bacterium]|nr:glycosyltransferase [Kiritimatiellia bacterium]HMO99320.1 glycosyltransferase [Kiritimatiellia bacterium]HMP96078.1 glycosyltransferase [Kiritimatiellia bacterium]
MTMPPNMMTEGFAGNRAFDRVAFPAMSVVMPTHKRPEALRRTLLEIARQAGERPEMEVIVCDDGSGDETIRVLQEAAGKEDVALAWISLPRSGGPAVARNHALRLARGRAILLLGDDIVPGPGLLQRHLRFHEEHPGDAAALLGYTTWPTEMAVTPFMKFLEGAGRAYFFAYPDLPPGKVVSGMYFYTCNVSFKRALCERAGVFDEQFPFASHEDLEFGLRLERTGMQLVYDPDAIGYHWHHLDLAGTVRRVYRMGHSAVLFWEKTGEQGSRTKRSARALLGMIAGLAIVRSVFVALMGRWADNPARWLLLLHAVYWFGYADGRRRRTDALLLNYGNARGG